MFDSLEGVVNKMVEHMEVKRKEGTDGVVNVKPIFQVGFLRLCS